jgi:hypothetical protein
LLEVLRGKGKERIEGEDKWREIGFVERLMRRYVEDIVAIGTEWINSGCVEIISIRDSPWLLNLQFGEGD